MFLDGRLNEFNMEVPDLFRLVDMLGLTDEEMMTPNRFEKFKEVIKYLARVEHKNLFIKRVTNSEMVDKLQKIWEYVKLAEKRDEADTNLISAKTTLADKYGENEGDDEEYFALKAQENQAISEIKSIDDEMRIYER